MIAPARTAAYKTLMAVESGERDLPSAIARSRQRLGDERDRALAAEIATGVERWRARLDHIIAACAKRPLDRLDPEIVQVLRLSVYQLLYLTRVPASAVVDDAVKMARQAGKASAAGFVNAVLRSVSRRRSTLPLPARPADGHDRDAALDYLSISLSHPRWLVARWYDRVGFEAVESWLLFNNTPAPLCLRANRLRVNREELAARMAHEGVAVHPGRFGPDTLVVDDGAPLAGSGLAEGWFVVQDEASQLVPLLAGEHPGTRVLDACASPGNKTVALAAAMGDAGLLVACDVRNARIDLLRKTVLASGARHVHPVQADLTMPLPFSEPFDCVLVDAPCSGLGTLRRDPDIRWRRREADLALLAERQLRMLSHAADAVRQGGRLVYATCSSEPEENQQVVDRFLSGRPEFAPLDARLAAPGLRSELVNASGHLATWPYSHQLEAFFGAVFERRL